MKLTLLPSDKGDCLFLESPDGTAILIDGGMKDSYVDHVAPFLSKWGRKNKRDLDLVYLSHIDQDHIAGVLQLMNDLADWRVYRHKKANKIDWDEPKSPEPPRVKRLWHNGFHDMVKENAGEIGSMLAARAAQLSNSSDPERQKLSAAYQGIAASIPESIQLSGRVSPKQLKIPLNKEFGGLLAMVRDPPNQIRLNGSKSPSIRVIGPFEDDLEKFRKKWNDWLQNKKNKDALAKARAARDAQDESFDFASMALDIDEELGNRKKVTEENLASLMLLIEQGGRRIVLTGDGHHAEIVRGLEHHGTIQAGQGLHVDVLKVQHHGSEHNLDREFARRITADHYVICGNGRHENPDLRVLKVIFEARMGTDGQLSPNKQAKDKFHVWFNCSVGFLQRDIAKRKAERRGFSEYKTAAEYFAKVESEVSEAVKKSKGQMRTHFLKDEPLTLTL